MTLSIVIVSWNVCDFLSKCIESIVSNLEDIEYEIIVVDNNSSDDSISKISSLYPSVKIISNSENMGFAKANNQGIAISRGDFILVLNPDTLIKDDSFQKMLDFIESDPHIGIVGCALTLPSGTMEAGAAGFRPTLLTAINYYFFLSKLYPLVFHGIYLNQESFRDKPVEVDWVSGACMMLRREVLTRNLFDEEFFMYAEDIELCDRVKMGGWKIFYMPYAKVIHFRGQSIKKTINSGASTLHIVGTEHYIRKNHGALYAKTFFFLHCSGLLLRFAIYGIMFSIKRNKFYLEKCHDMRRYLLTGIDKLFSV